MFAAVVGGNNCILMSRLIVYVHCHFVLRTYRRSGDCRVIDDLDKVMQVVLEMSFIVTAEQSPQKRQDAGIQCIIWFYVIEHFSTFV